MKLRYVVILLLITTPFCGSVASDAENSTIGYKSVAAALEALNQDSDSRVSLQEGWTIIQSRENDTTALWSFTPSSHPAHPAAVKRLTVEENGAVYIRMTALCEASKIECDKLIEQFKALNDRVRENMTKAENAVTVEEVGSDRFELILTSASALDIESAQASLVPTAESLCPDKYPTFGHYQFESAERLGQLPGPDNATDFKFIQQIACVEAVLAPETSDRKSFFSDPTEKRNVEERILQLSESYFADIFGGNYEKAFASLSAEMKSYRSFDEWSAQMDQLRIKSGSITSIDVHTITIYDNPPNAPQPGLYVAADYQNSFEKAPFHCGFLIWFRGESSDFEITREETGLLTYETLEQIPVENHETALAQMKCNAP